jgi:hypothetical protein
MEIAIFTRWQLSILGVGMLGNGTTTMTTLMFTLNVVIEGELCKFDCELYPSFADMVPDTVFSGSYVDDFDTDAFSNCYMIRG